MRAHACVTHARIGAPISFVISSMPVHPLFKCLCMSVLLALCLRWPARPRTRGAHTHCTRVVAHTHLHCPSSLVSHGFLLLSSAALDPLRRARQLGVGAARRG